MAKLPVKFDSQDKIPEPMREYYVERDGAWHLSDPPEGFVSQSVHDEVNQRLGEFRDNNRQLNTQLETTKTDHAAALKRFEGIDPTKVKTDLERLQELEASGVKKKDDLTAQIQSAVEAAVTPLKTQVTDLSGQLTSQKEETTKAQQAAALEKKRTTIIQAATEAGARKSAISDVLNRTMPRFELTQDGGLAGLDANGQPSYSRTNAANRTSLSEFLTELATGDGSHLFDPSAGGGAEQNRDGNKGAKRVLINPTDEQKTALLKEIASGEVEVRYE